MGISGLLTPCPGPFGAGRGVASGLPPYLSGWQFVRSGDPAGRTRGQAGGVASAILLACPPSALAQGLARCVTQGAGRALVRRFAGLGSPRGGVESEDQQGLLIPPPGAVGCPAVCWPWLPSRCGVLLCAGRVGGVVCCLWVACCAPLLFRPGSRRWLMPRGCWHTVPAPGGGLNRLRLSRSRCFVIFCIVPIVTVRER